MAGTVKAVGSISPRPRARYSSWIDADPQPSAWDALQMTQRTASRMAASGLKTASKTSSSMSSARSRRSSLTSSPMGLIVATPSRRARRSSAVEMCMSTILAKGRYQGEREERRHDQPHPAGEEIPVPRRARLRQRPPPEAAGPPPNRGQATNVEDRRQADDADRKRPDVLAVAAGKRTARWARARELEADEEGRTADDDHRPGQVEQQPAGQRRASSALCRAACSASRRLMRRYSKKRYTHAAAPSPATIMPKATDWSVMVTGQSEPPARLNASRGTSRSTVIR